MGPKLADALDKMILTASGWRSVFSADGTGKAPARAFRLKIKLSRL